MLCKRERPVSTVAIENMGDVVRQFASGGSQSVSHSHALHNGIEGLLGGDVLVRGGSLMNSGYDPQDVRSMSCWLGEQSAKSERSKSRTSGATLPRR